MEDRKVSYYRKNRWQEDKQKSAPTSILPHGGGRNFDLSLRKSEIQVGDNIKEQKARQAKEQQPDKNLSTFQPFNHSTDNSPSSYPPTLQPSKKAFTLAEVLITLGVIGVVAAMTMPTVIKKYQEQVTVNKVKKIYSTLNQAFMLSVKDNGYAYEWNVNNYASSTSAKQITGYLKPYLKISKDCGTKSGCLGYKEKVNLLNGNKHTVNYDTKSNYYKIILSDGSYLAIRANDGVYCSLNATSICGSIFFDVNGGKMPNTVGKDIFDFVIYPFMIKPATTDDCYLSSSGWGCTSYVLTNGNMNYPKDK